MQGFNYSMLMVGPGPIGGIVEEKNIPASHWMPYIAVDDVDKAAERCKELGGGVCVPPTDIPETGRFAVVNDPQGAFFSIYKGLPGSEGADPDLPIPGRVCWNEVLTTDEAKAQEFYSAMFGWTDAPKDMGPMGTYTVFHVGEDGVCGGMRPPMEVPPHWEVVFAVADTDASTAQADAAGATVINGPFDIPGVGRSSILADPTGAVFQLIQFENQPD